MADWSDTLPALVDEHFTGWGSGLPDPVVVPVQAAWTGVKVVSAPTLTATALLEPPDAASGAVVRVPAEGLMTLPVELPFDLLTRPQMNGAAVLLLPEIIARVEVPELVAAAELHEPTVAVAEDFVVEAPVMTADAEMPTPAPQGGITVDAPTMRARAVDDVLPFELPHPLGVRGMWPPVVSTSSVVSAPELGAAAELGVPVVESDAAVTAPMLAASAGLGSPVPSVTPAVVEPPVLEAGAGLLVPEVASAFLVDAPMFDAAAGMLAPGVVSSAGAVSPLLVASAGLWTPSVASGAGVVVPRATSSAGLWVPTPGVTIPPVEFDNASDGGSGGTSTRSWTHNLQGNCIVVVLTHTNGSNPTATYGGVSLTRVYGYASDGGVFPYTSRITIFARVGGLPTGNNTVSVSNAATASAGGAVSFLNAGSIGTVSADTASGNVSKAASPGANGASVAAYVGGSNNFGAMSPNENMRYSFSSFVTWASVMGWAIGNTTFTATHSGAKTGATVLILPA